ncbi:circadian clock protein KaiA [Nodosilinea sp. E11]|uniref:circadian clock protein KaiA n=1 Tax=Nodosilinea sp. E11 TaxID=3037479 RepID=UPI0029352578|nr:circadian clock protein KaiA [Nodosilinea sp. E11]WOD40595.1 circadian clock protein KaiA [Nodosilinea sp. E11]
MVAPLQIYILTHGDQVKQVPELNLDSSRYVVHQTTVLDDALDWLQSRPDLPDCLVVDGQVWEQALRPALMQLGLKLPVVVLIGQADTPTSDASSEIDAIPITGAEAYPGAVVHRADKVISQLDRVIQNAIQEFLRLPQPQQAAPTSTPVDQPAALSDSLSAQQHRLTEKLKDRLGYLGIYYKRNSSHFLRHMSQEDRRAFLGELKANYRIIVLGYFAKDPKIKLNQLIDDFVDEAFMADISVAQIVEIHMELMDQFAKQLKLEGRSEEILLDYRLTLIDVIAHLCEMYRRSIPREP